MHKYISVIIQSYSIKRFNNTKFTHNLETKKWLSSLQGLAFTRGLSTYKYKTTKIRKHKKKYKSGEESDNLNLT